jgi:argininosuccinate lyase
MIEGREDVRMTSTPRSDVPRDVNAAFRAGGRSVEFLHDINKASLLMLEEAGILQGSIASRIAAGIRQVIAEEVASPPWSADYLDYEPKLIAAAGPEASRLHAGRSRQDISSTIARMNLRDGLLAECTALAVARERMLVMAEAHRETIIPAYTHGVQAQPTTFAHYLLAFVSALARQSERLRQAYARVNRGPLGAAALTTSSFAIDRERLAALLGFEGLVENAYDANHLGPVDSALDVAGALAIAAVQVGQLAQDLHATYAQPVPWVMLRAGELTGVSSTMPQKRNPAALEQLRVQATVLLGEMQGVFLVAHNVRTGMFDYRAYDPVPSAQALLVFELLRKVVDGLVVDRERAHAEVRSDYSTTTEIADALLQRAGIPFRVGHHFASALTDHGRAQGLMLHEIPYAVATRIYGVDSQQPFPLSEAELREVISPEYMVFRRKGRGGPQLAEVDRMLSNERAHADSDRKWSAGERARLEKVSAGLDAAVATLAHRSPPG